MSLPRPYLARYLAPRQPLYMSLSRPYLARYLGPPRPDVAPV